MDGANRNPFFPCVHPSTIQGKNWSIGRCWIIFDWAQNLNNWVYLTIGNWINGLLLHLKISFTATLLLTIYHTFYYIFYFPKQSNTPMVSLGTKSCFSVLVVELLSEQSLVLCSNYVVILIIQQSFQQPTIYGKQLLNIHHQNYKFSLYLQ